MIFFQTPLDVLSLCKSIGNSIQPLFDIFNAILNPLGYFIPTTNEICTQVYDFLSGLAALKPI